MITTNPKLIQNRVKKILSSFFLSIAICLSSAALLFAQNHNKIFDSQKSYSEINTYIANVTNKKEKISLLKKFESILLQKAKKQNTYKNINEYLEFFPNGKDAEKMLLLKIKYEGKLKVITRYSPTSFFIGYQSVSRGFEHDLIKDFAEYLGVEADFEVYESISEILDKINDGDLAIAAAGLTKTKDRKEKFLFGPTYMWVNQRVVCRQKRKRKLPRNVSQLTKNSILVVRDSSYVETLEKLNERHEDLSWSETARLDSEEIMELVHLKKVDCTLIDSNIFNYNRRYYPELVSTFAVTSQEPLAWIINDKYAALKKPLERWFEKYRKRGKYAALEERYFGHVKREFNYYDTVSFHKAIKNKMHLYKDIFQTQAQQHGLPWKLLIAQSYQESLWEYNSISPAGARGLMMLMPATAKELGVKNHFNPHENISAGTRYLKDMLEWVPKEVHPEDKVWFALAAYNIGKGHVIDAMKLCRMFGLNPYSWTNLKKTLPKLKMKKYRKHLKFGKARGGETVLYVDNIRNFFDILKKVHIETELEKQSTQNLDISRSSKSS